MKKLNYISHRSILVAFLLPALLLSCSDSKASSLKKKFRNEAPYFLALRSLDKNDEKEAIRLFKESTSKSNPKVARLSAEALTSLGNVKERTSAADFLFEKYKDDDALTLATKVYFDQKEYTKVILMTEGIDLASAPDQLCSYRIESLMEKEDEHFEDELFKWFTSRPTTDFHYSLYAKYQKKIEISAPEVPAPENVAQAPETDNSQKATEVIQENSAPQLTPARQIMAYRLLILKKNYRPAFQQIDSILNLYAALEKNPDYQLISDMGKASLYGTDDFKTSAQKFERLAAKYRAQANSVPDTEAGLEAGELAYCAYFYSARLYDRAGRYQEKTVERFKQAMDSTKNSRRFDDALWYLLNMQLRMSTDDIVITLKKYAERISRPSYFDDFFDNFSVLLLSHQKWQDFYDVWKLIDGIATEETACKYAYISGRILEEGYGETDGIPKTKEAVQAYTRVLSGNASTYYKVSALERMNIVDKTYVTDVLCSGGPEIERKIDRDAEQLLAGYEAYGFPQKVYSTWLSNKDSISMEAGLQAVKYLGQCGVFDTSYNVQSLRLAARIKTNWSGKIPYELLELSFPQLYSNFIDEACAENNIRPPLLYALIRSESFFDANISSSAGAAGLTQLMQGTADDEARRLKLGNYDILDPKTNITLGSHYFARLIERTENKSELMALFGYNAGPQNAKKWKKPADLSMDLFLETLPFAETREYGRKLIGASAMYGFLYYDITPAETVRSLLK